MVNGFCRNEGQVEKLWRDLLYSFKAYPKKLGQKGIGEWVEYPWKSSRVTLNIAFGLLYGSSWNVEGGSLLVVEEKELWVIENSFEM